MRLIDADVLGSHIKKVIEKQGGKDIDLIPVSDLLTFIGREPTAYDVDKIVEQLEKLKSEKEIGGHKVIVKEAIEIVKAGGIDGDT